MDHPACNAVICSFVSFSNHSFIYSPIHSFIHLFLRLFVCLRDVGLSGGVRAMYR